MWNETSDGNGTLLGEAWWRNRVQVASPDWPELRSHVQWLWPVHAYGLACLFLGLAVTTFLTGLGLRAQLSARPHLSSLNVFLLLLGLTRCLCLFLDPYGSKQLIPTVMLAMLWDLGFPCLLSAFSLLQLAFLETTQAAVSPKRLADETCISLVVVLHFCLTIASDILWALQNTLRVVWLFSQLAFTAWGLFLCTMCVFSCMRLQRSIAELPMLFLPRTESTAWYDNKGILPLSTLQRSSSTKICCPAPGRGRTSGNGDVGPQDTLAPRIRITDENDQTQSYESSLPSIANTTSPTDPSQLNREISTTAVGVRSQGSMPLSPSQLREDSSQRKPLMAPNKVSSEYALASIAAGEAQGTTVARRATLPRASIVTHQWRREGLLASILTNGSRRQQQHPAALSDSLKPSRRSRVEKLLRQTMLAAIFGIALSILQGYGVAGPHGIFATTPRAEVLPWFAYQTVHRCLEFAMGCLMACISRKSLYGNSCYSHGAGGKHYPTLFS
ncbi:uncharacterized protein LOC135369908 [Ornithodoros turicata]|uniref:uncharacterized protein LOC135369908 n=1 Tax=Ornithodoros turicata TaxID=34597 RepID=UPI0031392E0E